MTESEKAATIRESKQRYGVEGLTYGSMGGYYTLAEIYAQLDSMRTRFPNLITEKITIGTTSQGRPIYAVKISDNPGVTENEPRTMFTSLIHAREPAAMMAVIYFMYYLMENYNSNPSVKYLVDNREIWFIPVINPDGYEYNRSTNPNGGGMWRKNRSLNSGVYGVDLNRNFGPQNYWNAPGGGSSTSPSADDYRGPSPFSELETQALKNFVAGKSFKNILNYHTYSNLLIYPYGYQTQLTPDSLIFNEFAADMVATNGYEPGTAWQLLYPVRGSSDDFLYDGDLENNGKIFAITVEVGSDMDDFWPPQSRIFPLAIENLQSNLYWAWVAGDYVRYASHQFNKEYINPGDQAELTLTLKNKGLSGADNVTVTVESLTNLVSVANGSASVPALPARGVYQIPTPFSISVSPTAPVDSMCQLKVSTFRNGVLISADTIGFVTGTPDFAFHDDSNDPLNKWTVTATPANPRWEATDVTFYTGPVSFTDSKVGNYANNATVAMVTTNNISLVGMAHPKFTFWTKWDMEARWDCGQVMISTNNGSSWIPLAGKLTTPGSGSGKQVPAGTPVYNGTSNTWKQEMIDLTPYAGMQIKLKFELRSDVSLNKDGWYVDDIGIYVYSAVPVELSSFSGKLVDGTVNLEWATASEVNNKGFEVQRSVNGSEWATVGFIDGAGTKTATTDYSFSEKINFTGTIQYRLKQIDFDGTYRLYGPVDIESAPVLSYDLMQNYPNPFNPETVIRFTTPVDGNVSIVVYDILGNKVASPVDGFVKAGSHSVTFKPSGLVSGIYFYEMTAPTFSKKLKMLYLK
ncbi:MAG: M14 family zinc carboxypeptidase [Ignavibacteriaceae bacterium]|nr:MAG: M14 family zinc carboxypeptidase [Ignavibacteriaceae bacterium]